MLVPAAESSRGWRSGRQGISAAKALLEHKAAIGPTELKVHMGNVRKAVTRLQPEALAAGREVERHNRGPPIRCGQWLTVGKGLGQWADVVVGSDGVVRLEDGVMLRPWNHAPRELPHDAFETMLVWYMDTLRAQHSFIVDALSGKRLHVLEQCVPIDVVGDTDQSSVRTGFDLGGWLAGLHTRCCLGSVFDRPAAVLLTGPPAAGKTSMMSQVVMHLLLMRNLVPIAIKVQRLQVRLLATPDAFTTSWNWVEAYLRLEHGEGALYLMLRQALAARRALILLDGLDEGGQVREQISGT